MNHRLKTPLAPPGEAIPEVTSLFDHGEWTCECTVAIGENGEPIIKDLRISPQKGVGVPRGGLTTRMLREIRLGEHRAVLTSEFKRMATGGIPREERTTAVPAAPGRTGGTRIRQGPEYLDRDIAEGLGLTESRVKRPGRRGRPDRFYAELAREYVELLNGGSQRPTAKLAAARNYSAAHVRDAVHEARERGLLTRPATRGRAGGDLTAKAKAMLDDSPLSQDLSHRSRPRAASTYADPRKRRSLMRKEDGRE